MEQNGTEWNRIRRKRRTKEKFNFRAFDVIVNALKYVMYYTNLTTNETK